MKSKKVLKSRESIVPILLDFKQFCEYLNIGETKGRELLKDRRNGFTVYIGNRVYAHRERLDQWLEEQMGR